MPWNMSVARCANLAALWVVWSRKWSFCPRWSIHFLSIYGSRFRVSVQHTHIRVRTHALARTFTFVRTYVAHTYVCKWRRWSYLSGERWEPPQLIGNQNANELCAFLLMPDHSLVLASSLFGSLFYFSHSSSFHLFTLTFRRWGRFIHGVRPVDGRWFKIPFTEPSECLFLWLLLLILFVISAAQIGITSFSLSLFVCRWSSQRRVWPY